MYFCLYDCSLYGSKENNTANIKLKIGSPINETTTVASNASDCVLKPPSLTVIKDAKGMLIADVIPNNRIYNFTVIKSIFFCADFSGIGLSMISIKKKCDRKNKFVREINTISEFILIVAILLRYFGVYLA